jgi:hypothetical protein
VGIESSNIFKYSFSSVLPAKTTGQYRTKGLIWPTNQPQLIKKYSGFSLKFRSLTITFHQRVDLAETQVPKFGMAGMALYHKKRNIVVC